MRENEKWSCYRDRNQSITDCPISLAQSSLTVPYDRFLAHLDAVVFVLSVCLRKILTTCQCVEQVKSHISPHFANKLERAALNKLVDSAAVRCPHTQGTTRTAKHTTIQANTSNKLQMYYSICRMSIPKR